MAPPGTVPCPRCAAQPVVTRWTGAEVRLLRQAVRMSIRVFAARLGITHRMVTKWETGGAGITPRPVNQAALDTMVGQADAAARRRFAIALAERR